MNIFMILCDELRADTLGYAGNNLISTPNIDSLANDSVIFENSFCNSPMCVPSRVSISTGRHALSHGALDNMLSPFKEEVSFYQILQQSQYKTFSYGKWHTNIVAEDFGLDFNITGKNLVNEVESTISCFGMPSKFRKNVTYKKTNGIISLIIHGQRPTEPDDTLDSVVTDSYIKYLKSIDFSTNKVFARLSLLDPHSPYFPSKPYASMYDYKTMPMPKSLNASLKDKPVLQRYFHHTRGFYELTEDDFKKSKASYYSLVSHVDDRVGKTINTLKKLNLYDDNLIIFTSDHGSMLGEHGFIEKWGYMYDQVIKTPLLIKLPKNKHAGKKLDSFVESIDLMPTILDLINQEIPKRVQGKSLLPYMNGQTDKHKDEIYAQYYCGALQEEPALMIRNKQWKLTSYPEGNSLEQRIFLDDPLRMSSFFDGSNVLGELYNLKNDPDEMINLFDNPKYKNIKNDYLNKIQKWKNNLGALALTKSKIKTVNIGTYSFIQGTNMDKTLNILGKKEPLSTLKKRAPI